jgi:hypothetical protein
MDQLEQSRTSFKEYSPTTPRDGHRGPRGQRRAQQRLDERALAEGRVADDPIVAEDASLATAEAQLLAYLATDTEDDEDFIPTIPIHRAAHDDEVGTSGARDPAPAPPVTATQVVQPDSLAAILRRLTYQQSRFAKEQCQQREVQTQLLVAQARQQEA